MSWLLYVVAVVFFLLGAVCVVLVMAQLPGAWIMLALAGLIEYCDRFYLPAGDQQTFGWWVLGTCVVLAMVGEALEFIGGAIAVKKTGGSRRGMIGALIGGVVGAILGTPFGLIIGAMIGAALGAFVGAILGELTVKEATVKGSIKPATGAAIGRVLGTLSKMPFAIAIWLALSISAFWA